MIKTKSYKVVEANSLDKLSDIVNDYIYNEWQPIGGVQVVKLYQGDADVVMFYQALVEYYPQTKNK